MMGLSYTVIIGISVLIILFSIFNKKDEDFTPENNGSRDKTFFDLQEMWGILHPPNWKDSMLDTV
jgi:hypothetical protein